MVEVLNFNLEPTNFLPNRCHELIKIKCFGKYDRNVSKLASIACHSPNLFSLSFCYQVDVLLKKSYQPKTKIKEETKQN